MQQTGLRASVSFDLESHVVLPGDMQAAGTLHYSHRAIGFARVTFGSVFIGIPGVGSAARERVERHVGDVAFLRLHAEAPFVDDLRHPVAGEIDGSGRFGRGGSGRSSAAAALRVKRGRQK